MTGLIEGAPDEVLPAGADHAADATLLARAARGDDRAFAQIYEAHRRRLYRLAYGVLLDPTEARDAVQEAFLRLHQAAPSWEPRAAIGTWLHRVVLNHSLGLRRRLLRLVQPTGGRPGASRERRDGRSSPERTASLRQARHIVEQSIADLPIRQRAVACLFLEAELTPAEIAPLVDMTPNATRVALHRALNRLREDLRVAGIEAVPAPNESAQLEEDQ